MYETQELLAHFDKELPDNLAIWLNEMVKGIDNIRKPSNHPLFKTERWELLGRQSDEDLSKHHFIYKDNWLYVNSTLKNYDQEYDEFIGLIDPYTDLVVEVRYSEVDEDYPLTVKGEINNLPDTDITPPIIKEWLLIKEPDKTILSNDMIASTRIYTPLTLNDVGCTLVPLNSTPIELSQKMYVKLNDKEYMKLNNGQVLQWDIDTQCHFCIDTTQISIIHKNIHYNYNTLTGIITRE